MSRIIQPASSALVKENIYVEGNFNASSGASGTFNDSAGNFRAWNYKDITISAVEDYTQCVLTATPHDAAGATAGRICSILPELTSNTNLRLWIPPASGIYVGYGVNIMQLYPGINIYPVTLLLDGVTTESHVVGTTPGKNQLAINPGRVADHVLGDYMASIVFDPATDTVTATRVETGNDCIAALTLVEI